MFECVCVCVCVYCVCVCVCLMCVTEFGYLWLGECFQACLYKWVQICTGVWSCLFEFVCVWLSGYTGHICKMEWCVYVYEFSSKRAFTEADSMFLTLQYSRLLKVISTRCLCSYSLAGIFCNLLSVLKLICDINSVEVVCMCMYMYVCLCMCMHVYVCVCMCMYVYLCVCVCICIYVYVYVCACVSLYRWINTFRMHIWNIIWL